MIKFVTKIVVVLLCSIVAVGTASAQTETKKESKREKTTVRDRIEAGWKKV
jgi:hypothetical protein